MPRIPAPPGRRRVLPIGAGLVLFAPALLAQGPAPEGRPVRVLVASPTGGTADTILRLIQPQLASFLGQPVVVENRSGGGGALAAAPVAAAPADGHTLLFDAASFLLAPFVNRALPFDYERDFVPLGTVAEVPLILAASAGTGIRDLHGYLDQARIMQDAMPYGTAGVGDVGHLAGLLLAHRTGLPMEHIAYRSVARVARDLAAGTLPSAYLPADALAPITAAGRARAIALTSGIRHGGLGEVPTIAEAGFPGFDLTNWNALFCRAGTPEPVRQRLEAALGFAVRDKEVRRRLAVLGAVAATDGAAALGARLGRERMLLSGLIREAGISAG